MGLRLIGSLRGILGAAYGLTRHVVWYLNYRVRGTVREQQSGRSSPS